RARQGGRARRLRARVLPARLPAPAARGGLHRAQGPSRERLQDAAGARDDAPAAVVAERHRLRRILLRRGARVTVSPRLYARITTIALVLLTLIVMTGAAVRLTGSGLGCPTWPECRGAVIQTELDTHGAIEYGNRLLTGLVAAGAIAAFLAAFLRRPFRRDLATIGGLLPIGVVGQAVLGGLAVLYGLAPGWV